MSWLRRAGNRGQQTGGGLAGGGLAAGGLAAGGLAAGSRTRRAWRGDGSESRDAADPRVVLYTRAGCHLCDVAAEVVEIVCAELDEEFIAIDIDAVPELKSRFADAVPVVSVDGVLVAKWRVSPEALRVALGT